MISIEAQELILNIKKELNKSGLSLVPIVEDLKKLRPYFIESEDPTITRVIRLTYEHLEQFETFKIGIPQEEMVDENGEVIDTPPSVASTPEESVESLDYMISLFIKGKNKLNRADIIIYRDQLIASLK